MAKEQARVPATWLYRVGKAILYPFYRLVYRIRVVGGENVPSSGPVLLCSNHMALKDAVMLGIVLKRQIFYMGKEELFQGKFLGGLLRMLGVFPVARGTGGAEGLQSAENLLKKNALVGIFIEGTRSKTGELGRPKTGAALLAYQTQAPVLPACITGDTGSFCRPFHRSIIQFGPVLPPEELGIADASSLQLRRASRTIMGRIAAMREESRAMLGVPALPEKTEEAP